jgi:diaminopimelate epimerase
MPKISFIKGQALGNDFVIIPLNQDGFETIPETNLPDISRFISNRRLGIGCDQVIYMDAPKDPSCAMSVRFFNADGSEAESCGNGSRTIGLWWMQKKNTQTVKFHSQTNLITTNLIDKNAGIIELILPTPIIDAKINIGKYQGLSNPPPVVVIPGNPHIVLFVEQDNDAEKLGEIIGNLPQFTKGINVNFVTRIHKNKISLTVWERGVGLTPACGTGAIATAVAAKTRGLVNGDHEITVIQAGGGLSMAIHADHLTQRGAASIVYEGTIQINN